MPRTSAVTAFASVVVLTLYFSSDTVRQLYRDPTYLWMVFPLILYWLTRMLVLTYRGKMNEDPILFAIKDRVTYFVLAAAGAIMWVAMHPDRFHLG